MINETGFFYGGQNGVANNPSKVNHIFCHSTCLVTKSLNLNHSHTFNMHTKYIFPLLMAAQLTLPCLTNGGVGFFFKIGEQAKK